LRLDIYEHMASQTRILYVLTHTETYYNRKRIFTGRLNSILTPLGHRQAEKMAQKLKNKKIGLAFISPLARSKQTLAHILRHHTLGHIIKYHPGLEVNIDKRIRERDYGKLDRKSKVKYRREHPELYELHHRSYQIAPPGGESMIEVEKRVLSFLKHVITMVRKKRINAVVIVHNNSIRPIRRYFERLTPEQMMHQDNRHKIFSYQIKI
jgi:2,3-bisphosphoglycerate-dependent phosphoglycerate mutase